MTTPADPREALARVLIPLGGWAGHRPDPLWREGSASEVAGLILAALNDAGYTLAARQDEPSPCERGGLAGGRTPALSWCRAHDGYFPGDAERCDRARQDEPSPALRPSEHFGVRHGVIEYDPQDEWITETDVDGASRIVAMYVPDWFGKLVARALAANPPQTREAEEAE